MVVVVVMRRIIRMMLAFDWLLKCRSYSRIRKNRIPCTALASSGLNFMALLPVQRYGCRMAESDGRPREAGIIANFMKTTFWPGACSSALLESPGATPPSIRPMRCVSHHHYNSTTNYNYALPQQALLTLATLARKTCNTPQR